MTPGLLLKNLLPWVLSRPLKVTFCAITNRKIALSSMVEVVVFKTEGNVLFIASMSSNSMCKALGTNVDCIACDENAEPCMATLPMKVSLSKTMNMSLAFCGVGCMYTAPPLLASLLIKFDLVTLSISYTSSEYFVYVCRASI